MKKKIALILCLIALLGCKKKELPREAYDANQSTSRIVITVYDGTGKVIKEWKGAYYIDVSDSGVKIYEENRGMIGYASGTILIEHEEAK